MKLKVALKKFSFLKHLHISDKQIEVVANHLARTLVGSTDEHITPLAKRCNPIDSLSEWDMIFDNNVHKLNVPLLELERANRKKFGPRSIAVPWSQRLNSMLATYHNQDEKHIPIFKYKPGNSNLKMASLSEAIDKSKRSTSAGLPFLKKKGKCVKDLLADFDNLLNRRDPCMLYTRTTECKKTRNVWGYPFADTLYEMVIYIPLLAFQKSLSYRASLVSPDAVAISITGIIRNAISSGKSLYSVDFKGFDTSVKYQYIILAFDYVKSCFDDVVHPFIAYVCKRMYTIGIVTPSGYYRDKNHGIPSGSTFTNEIDSIVQVGIASNCSFIHLDECQVQGDDGVYSMHKEDIQEFERAFEYAGLHLEKSKSVIASDYVVFCQNLYHIDYLNEYDFIGGIYPTYRALNRLLFQERFVDFSKAGIQGRDYFGIRSLSILENCKYHPLFEELVRFVLSKEKFSLDISDDGLLKYCTHLGLDRKNVENLNHQYGTQVMGIKGFASYKVAKRILAEEEFQRSYIDTAGSEDIMSVE